MPHCCLNFKFVMTETQHIAASTLSVTCQGLLCSEVAHVRAHVSPPRLGLAIIPGKQHTSTDLNAQGAYLQTLCCDSVLQAVIHEHCRTVAATL